MPAHSRPSRKAGAGVILRRRMMYITAVKRHLRRVTLRQAGVYGTDRDTVRPGGIRH